MARLVISIAILDLTNSIEQKNQLPAGEPSIFAIQSKGVVVDILDTFSDLGLYFSEKSLPFPETF